MLRMCHGCVYTDSFVLDCHALYLQHLMSIEYMESHVNLFRNESVHEFYRLKALITLEQVITSVVEKKRTILVSKTSMVRLTGRVL